MIQTGIVKKVSDDLVWFDVSPEGGTCADCSCDKPVRTLIARLDAGEQCEPGMRIVARSNGAATMVAALALLVLGIGSGTAVWLLLGSGVQELLRVGLTIGAVFAGLLLAVLLARPFRGRFLPKAKVVHLHFVPLHTGES